MGQKIIILWCGGGAGYFYKWAIGYIMAIYEGHGAF
jgi:hypothetical protein